MRERWNENPEPRIDKAILRKKADCFAVYNTVSWSCPLSGRFQQEKEAVTTDRGSRVAAFAAGTVTRVCIRMKTYDASHHKSDEMITNRSERKYIQSQRDGRSVNTCNSECQKIGSIYSTLFARDIV